MSVTQTKRQNFDITPEQEAEIAGLREALDLSSAKDAILRAVRIATLFARAAAEGKEVLLRAAGGTTERLVIPELERLAAAGWRYLVQREHPWRRQMSVKGRRLLASTVWRDMITNGQTPEQGAQEWGIPLEAVEEVIRWCQANEALVEMESQEERRRLASAEVPAAPAP